MTRVPATVGRRYFEIISGASIIAISNYACFKPW
jgi:hypothetical protein